MQKQNLILAVLGATVALALAGCGIGVNGNKTSKTVSIKVTGDFGSRPIGSGSLRSVPSADTIMGLTRNFFHVTTSRGGTVHAINGHAADPSGTRGWSFYVNGIAATKGASATALYPGDTVWWDLHDRRAVEDVPAVVGSYPEPFLTGSGGQSYPTVVTCADGFQSECHTVTDSLSKAGIKVSFSALGNGSGSDSLTLLVGTLQQLQGTIAGELLKAGPHTSGVYGQFIIGTDGAEALELDDPAGDTVRTFHGSVGMIAAIEQSGLNEPVWLVTGTDRAGVRAAAAALTPAKLANHFAVAVRPGGDVLPLPLAAAR